MKSITERKKIGEKEENVSKLRQKRKGKGKGNKRKREEEKKKSKSKGGEMKRGEKVRREQVTGDRKMNLYPALVESALHANVRGQIV